MIKYNYKCVNCSCMFTKDEIVGFSCPAETSIQNKCVLYVCKKCYPPKEKNQQRNKKVADFLRKTLDLHIQQEHGPIDISEL